MTSPLPNPRAMLQRLAEPRDFQPFRIVTKDFRHLPVAAPERIEFPPNSDREWVQVYLTQEPKTVYFDSVACIEFDPAAGQNPVPFARRVWTLRVLIALMGLEFGVVIGWCLGLRDRARWAKAASGLAEAVREAGQREQSHE